MMRTFGRDFYIPKDYTEKVTRKGVEAEVFLIDHGTGRKPCAMGFGGKRAKADFYNSYMSVESRALHVKTYLDNLEERAAAKKTRAAEKKAFEHTLKVGDILYTSWGYDQTNIDYYQVTAVVGKKSVKIRQIHSGLDHHDGCSQNYVIPLKDSFFEDCGEYDHRGDEMLKRVGEYNSIRIESYCSATPWGGKPNRETDAYSGH
jgi:hypothetical protein